MYISSMQVLRLETKSCKITVKLYSSSLKSYENFDRPAFSPIKYYYWSIQHALAIEIMRLSTKT